MRSTVSNGGDTALGLADVAEMLGANLVDLDIAAGDLIERADLRYRVIEGPARDDVILRVLKTLESALPRSGPSRADDWERGWGENLAAFRASGDLDVLVPAYYRRGRQVMRLRGAYVLPATETFELAMLGILRVWIGQTFLVDATHIYEFGCGPAHNLIALAQRYPHKELWGLDWAVASQEIIETLAVRHGFRMRGERFDMLAPRRDCRLAPEAAVLTMGALEQLGTAFQLFLEYLLDQRPRVCVHVEPIDELYDRAVLFDHLAARYAERRGYLSGFLTTLRALEQRGRLRIRHVKKNLGSLYHDGWTTLAWSPR
jgi:hypothetical protein